MNYLIIIIFFCLILVIIGEIWLLFGKAASYFNNKFSKKSSKKGD